MLFSYILLNRYLSKAWLELNGLKSEGKVFLNLTVTCVFASPCYFRWSIGTQETPKTTSLNTRIPVIRKLTLLLETLGPCRPAARGLLNSMP